MPRQLTVLSNSVLQNAPEYTFRTAGGSLLDRQLLDRQRRVYTYVRLSVTDRCDMRCVYCTDDTDTHAARAELLSAEQIAVLGRSLARLGVEKIRLTGGEPLLRKDIVEIAARLHAELPQLELALSTNGTLLAQHASSLQRAGVSSVNISIDSLEVDNFARITRGGDLGRVLAGTQAALDSGMQVQWNTVAAHNLNGHELLAIAQRAHAMGVVPRFIEWMPLGAGATQMQHRMDKNAILNALQSGEHEAVQVTRRNAGPARLYRTQTGIVGLITAVSDPFCDSCNRLRISATGELQSCLGHQDKLALGPYLDEPKELEHVLATWLGRKPAGHVFDDALGTHASVRMRGVGG